jgi:hypothetical protein
MSDARCSVKAYSESRGISRTTLIGILKNKGKHGIVFGYNEEVKENPIYPDILDKEWFLRYRVEQEAKGKVFVPKEVGKELAVMGPGDAGATKAGDWKFVNSGAGEPAPGGVDAALDNGEVDYGFKAGGRLDFVEAQRVWMLNKARSVKMEADEMEGVLIRRDQVNKELHTAGIQIRKEVEQLPARAVDKVRAAKTRTEALNELEDEVMAMMERIVAKIEQVFGEDNEKKVS